MRAIDADALKRYMDLEDAVKYGNKTDEQQQNSYDTLMKYEIADCIDDMPTLDYEPVRHGEWILTESPYAEYEEGVDGESHDRWTCSLCGGEAGFDCDPDGFASGQDKTKFCPNCGAKMDAKEGDG